MADTIEGGAYQNAAGAWFDAEGKPLKENQIAAAQALHAERAAALQKEEQERVERAVRNDPMAQVLASALNRPQTPDEAPHQRGRRSAAKDDAET